MKKKVVLSAFLLLGFSFLLLLPCDKDLYCHGYMTGNLQYLIVWFLSFTLLSLLGLIVNDQKHKFWLKFTAIFSALSVLIVYMTPEYGSGIVSIDRELTNWLLAGLYSFISVVYFITQFVKNRR